MLITSRGVFSEDKKRLRQAHRPRGGGRDPKTDEHSHKSFILVQHVTIYHFKVDLFESIKYAYGHIPCVDIYESDYQVDILVEVLYLQELPYN